MPRDPHHDGLNLNRPLPLEGIKEGLPQMSQQLFRPTHFDIVRQSAVGVEAADPLRWPRRVASVLLPADFIVGDPPQTTPVSQTAGGMASRRLQSAFAVLPTPPHPYSC